MVSNDIFEYGSPKDVVNNYTSGYRRGPSQDAIFFYTPSHLSKIKSFKSIILTHSLLFSYLNSARHNLVIELCREQLFIFFLGFQIKST